MPELRRNALCLVMQHVRVGKLEKEFKYRKQKRLFPEAKKRDVVAHTSLIRRHGAEETRSAFCQRENTRQSRRFRDHTTELSRIFFK